MKLRFLAVPAVSLITLAFAACSATPDETPFGKGGQGSGSGGANNSMGGATTANGGTTGSGGTAPGNGGNTNGNGGTTNNGGASNGGTTSSNNGGASAGGATNAGGTSGNSGGKTSNGGGSNGGKANAGGSNTGGSGTGGAAGGTSTGEKFSFFVTSIGAMRELSKSQDGFGGDLRFGEADGLAGADKICRTIAEKAMAGAGSKTWRAFLSTVKGPVNAIDRIGNGPWYDRLGRLVSMNRTDILNTRPKGADSAIINDLPNENGIPNHQDGMPGCVGNACPDNHDVLTGTGPDGKLYSMTVGSTCADWTTSVGQPSSGTGSGGASGSGGRSGGGFQMANGPWCGHSWPRQGSGENWMSALAEGGCAPGVNLKEQGGPQQGVYTVGTGGGYGAIYCFALTP